MNPPNRSNNRNRPEAAERQQDELLVRLLREAEESLLDEVANAVREAEAAGRSPNLDHLLPPLTSQDEAMLRSVSPKDLIRRFQDKAAAANPAPLTETVSSPITAAPESPTPIPSRLGRFEIRRLVGEGAFGRVYEAHDPHLDRVVALKVAKPEQLASERHVKLFHREARAAGNLRHPHIVPVFDSGQDGPHHYIASALIQGQSLAEMVAALPKGQTLPPRQAALIVRRLAEALAYAHKQGIVHRDVKPGNVMIEQGEPMLMDFGLAARPEGGEKLTHVGEVLGPPEYLAPEQWDSNAGPASDQYSLGCLLYELLTGAPPFAGNLVDLLLQHQKETPLAPRRRRRSLPRDLETICLKTLPKQPGERYGGCQELADDLRR